MTATWRILEGDARERLRDIRSIQTCVTSPPYFGLRDYDTLGQLGLEPTLDEYVANLVAVFSQVRRVLRDDGTVWINLGDSYGPGKQLLGMPWRFAFAMQRDGWVLRQEVIWEKSNPMPESVTDRCTKSHEQIFMFVKEARYFYDADAIREPHAEGTLARPARLNGHFGGVKDPHPHADEGRQSGVRGHVPNVAAGRNRRSVWTIATQPYPGAHFATFPAKLIEPCILAGSRFGDTVLDPFAGSGTAGLVALRHGRSFIGIELNPKYAQMARDRIVDDAPLLNSFAEEGT